MSFFRDLTDDEVGFQDFNKKQIDDDERLKQYFEKSNHKDFTFAILHLGVLLDTIATYCDFMKEQLQDMSQETSSRSLKRKANKFVKDINDRINSEYNFDDDTVIVEEMILFEDEFYLFFDKSHFIKTMGLQSISYE